MQVTIALLFGFVLGAALPILVALIARKDLVTDSARQLRQMLEEIRSFRLERKSLEQEIGDLRESVLGLRNEREAMHVAWEKADERLQSTDLVDANQAVLFGRGTQSFYAYTYDRFTQLAHDENRLCYPIRIGGVASESLISEIDKLVSKHGGRERGVAIVLLVFRVRDAAELELFIQRELRQSGTLIERPGEPDWFDTNPERIEQLVRSYVLLDDGLDWKQE